MSETPPTVSPYAPPSSQPPGEGNGQAIASMVLGILSFVLCGPFFSVPAVILGHMCLGKVRQGRMGVDARGFALAGTILGWINIGLVLIVLALYVLLVVIAGGAGRVAPFVYQL